MTTACTVCELHAESTFKVEGMDCREEVALLERRFKNLVSLEDFSADLMGRRLHVKYDAAKLSASAIAGAVADTGMRAWLEHEEPLASSEPNNRRRQALVWTSGLALAAGLVTQAISAGGSAEAVLGWCLPDVAAVGVGTIACFVISLAAGIPLTAGKAGRAPETGAPGSKILILIAATGAVILGQWSQAAAVVFLVALAQMLEGRTLDRSRN